MKDSKRTDILLGILIVLQLLNLALSLRQVVDLAKMGRPLKSSEPLSKTVLIRMTENMHKELSEFAKAHDMSNTDVAREAIRQFIER